jgi:cell division protein FtsW
MRYLTTSSNLRRRDRGDSWVSRLRERFSFKARPEQRGWRTEYVFLALVLGLTVFGLVMLSSASSVLAYKQTGDGYYYAKHQLFSGVLPGLLLFVIAWRIPYQRWQRFALPCLAATIVLLILPLVPGIGAPWGTANIWVQIGPISFQPNEVAKLTLVIFLAGWFAERGAGMTKDFWNGLLPFTLVVGAVAALLVLAPDFGTLMVYVAIAGAIYLVAGASWRHMIGLLSVGFFSLLMLILQFRHSAQRLTTFLHPELDPQGIGYQVNQALLAIGSGGLFGLGYGQSRQKLAYLPEVMGDSIFAIIAEELGLIFTVGLVAVYGIIAFRALRLARTTKDAFAQYLVIGITAWFIFQAIANMGAMLGLLPLTGVPLPLVSYGGTASAIMLAALGIVASVARSESK